MKLYLLRSNWEYLQLRVAESPEEETGTLSGKENGQLNLQIKTSLSFSVGPCLMTGCEPRRGCKAD